MEADQLSISLSTEILGLKRMLRSHRDNHNLFGE